MSFWNQSFTHCNIDGCKRPLMSSKFTANNKCVCTVCYIDKVLRGNLK